MSAFHTPLFGKIKWKDSDVQEKWLTDLQLHQNKMLRHLNGSKIADKISTKSILNKHNINSVNQMNAQIKLLDIWKAANIINHPTKLEKMTACENMVTTRAIMKGNLVEKGVIKVTKNTFLNDAKKAWNKAPESLKSCKTIWSAKKEIQKFVKTLPV